MMATGWCKLLHVTLPTAPQDRHYMVLSAVFMPVLKMVSSVVAQHVATSYMIVLAAVPGCILLAQSAAAAVVAAAAAIGGGAC